MNEWMNDWFTYLNGFLHADRPNFFLTSVDPGPKDAKADSRSVSLRWSSTPLDPSQVVIPPSIRLLKLLSKINYIARAQPACLRFLWQPIKAVGCWGRFSERFLVSYVSRSMCRTYNVNQSTAALAQIPLGSSRHVSTRVELVETSVSSRLFDKLDTAKMHGVDTSNVSCRVETWRATCYLGLYENAASCTAVNSSSLYASVALSIGWLTICVWETRLMVTMALTKIGYRGRTELSALSTYNESLSLSRVIFL